jgi:hypothetical protein
MGKSATNHASGSWKYPMYVKVTADALNGELFSVNFAKSSLFLL